MHSGILYTRQRAHSFIRIMIRTLEFHMIKEHANSIVVVVGNDGGNNVVIAITEAKRNENLF